MDSDSQTPAMGIDLMPRRGKETASVGTGGKSRVSAVEPVVHEVSAAEPSSPSSWGRWFNRLGSPSRIPLPRTDLKHEVEEPVTLDSDSDVGSAFEAGF